MDRRFLKSFTFAKTTIKARQIQYGIRHMEVLLCDDALFLQS